MSSAVAAGSPFALAPAAVPMSLIPSSTMSQRTPGCASTSRSRRASAFGPRPSRSRRLPPIPAFSTATCAVAGDACRRRARTSGQRSLPLVVDPRPSVIESPRIDDGARRRAARRRRCRRGSTSDRPARRRAGRRRRRRRPPADTTSCASPGGPSRRAARPARGSSPRDSRAAADRSRAGRRAAPRLRESSPPARPPNVSARSRRGDRSRCRPPTRAMLADSECQRRAAELVGEPHAQRPAAERHVHDLAERRVGEARRRRQVARLDQLLRATSRCRPNVGARSACARRAATVVVRAGCRGPRAGVRRPSARSGAHRRRRMSSRHAESADVGATPTGRRPARRRHQLHRWKYLAANSMNVGQFGPGRMAAAVLAERDVAVDERRLDRRELRCPQVLLAEQPVDGARAGGRRGTSPSRRPSRPSTSNDPR